VLYPIELQVRAGLALSVTGCRRWFKFGSPQVSIARAVGAGQGPGDDLEWNRKVGGTGSDRTIGRSMAEPLKNLIRDEIVQATGWHLRRAWPKFDQGRFQALALDGLEELELKARAMHVCDALDATLPADFAQAATILERSLAPAVIDDDLGALKISDAGLAGFAVWPLTEFIARRGLDQPSRALLALHGMTQRFTSEWALRPFLERHPELVFATLQAWTRDRSPHVRRLVSEGTRPRLPWGRQLKFLITDPSPTLPLLEVLQDDPSPYVRRSVANHLNDIAKDHPGILVEWLRVHLPEASGERQAMLRHASRTLVKKGDRQVLKAFGLGRRLQGTAALKLGPRRVRVGDEITLEVTLGSEARRAQQLVVDYTVHHVKANGGTSPKVFKGWKLGLAPGANRMLRKRHSLRRISTRVYHPGVHRVDLCVNGETVATAEFQLRL
jgi:3-methyladenine DNA glycosylase AlkC